MLHVTNSDKLSSSQVVNKKTRTVPIYETKICFYAALIFRTMSEINYSKTISLFIFSAIAFEYNSRKRRKEQKNLYSSIKESRLVTHEDKISSRGASQLNPILPYLGAFFKCLSVSTPPLNFSHVKPVFYK